jgi:uncharacterized protein
MHLTLHLTGRCNFRCRYCYAAAHRGGDMTFETAAAAIDLGRQVIARERPDGTMGVIFFGGEPLLQRDLIARIVRHCREVEAKTGQLFHFKITTNGALLDERFLVDPDTRDIFVALSHDGVAAAHDAHRIDVAGQGTFARLDAVIALLLEHQPFAPVMLVTTPETVAHYAASVRYLADRGFRYLICSLDYGAAWTARNLREIERQYGLLADWYVDMTRREEKFYFSPFEVKIGSHVRPGSCRAERCELGRKQISVGPSGRLYPCVQFVGDDDGAWAIGDVRAGLDEARRMELYRLNDAEKATCGECAIRERCNHYCGCLNKQATGDMTRVSPMLCAHERIALPIADRVAEKLFKQRSALFIQKQYNELYPLVSLAEERGRTTDGRNR